MKRWLYVLTLVIAGVFLFSALPAQARSASLQDDIFFYLPFTVVKGPTAQGINQVTFKGINDFIPATDYLYIVGEIVNQTPNNVRFIWIKARLYNASNQVIYTTPDPGVVPLITILKPQDKTPFRLIINPIPAGYTHYDLSLTCSKTTEEVYSLETKNVTTSWNNVFNAYHVMGTAHNQTGATRSAVEAVVTLYDAGGKVVGVNKILTTPASINANADATFDVEIMSWDGSPDRNVISSYGLRVVDD